MSNCFDGQKKEWKYWNSGNKTYMFQIWLFKSFNMSHNRGDWSTGTWCAKSRSKHEPSGFWKSRFDGFMTMFGGFSRNVPQGIEKISCRCPYNTFAKLIWYKSCHFSNRVFFTNPQCVTLWLLNHCLRDKNGEDTITLRIFFCRIPIQVFAELKGRVGVCLNERVHSLESSLQSILSNWSLWKRMNWSVVFQTWSWRGKPAAGTRAGLREANAER